jgi:hypothetical protein
MSAPLPAVLGNGVGVVVAEVGQASMPRRSAGG